MSTFFFKGMGGAPFDAIFFITVFTETVKCLNRGDLQTLNNSENLSYFYI